MQTGINSQKEHQYSINREYFITKNHNEVAMTSSNHNEVAMDSSSLPLAEKRSVHLASTMHIVFQYETIAYVFLRILLNPTLNVFVKIPELPTIALLFPLLRREVFILQVPCTLFSNTKQTFCFQPRCSLVYWQIQP